jgi:hypothetical protein
MGGGPLTIEFKYHKYPADQQCGFMAIANLLGKEMVIKDWANDIWEYSERWIYDDNERAIKRKKVITGLGCKQIQNLIHKIDPSVKFYCGFCSPKRTEHQIPFPRGMVGIAALKFRDDDDTHWLAWDGKQLVDWNGDIYKSRAEINAKYKRADWWGYKLAILDSDSKNVITDTFGKYIRSKRIECPVVKATTLKPSETEGSFER